MGHTYGPSMPRVENCLEGKKDVQREVREHYDCRGEAANLNLQLRPGDG